MRIRSLKTKGNDLRQQIADGRAVYCGREFAGLPASVLGNPFKVSIYGTGKCVELYRRWLWEQLKTETPQKLAIQRLEADSTIVCWCIDVDQNGVVNEDKQPFVCHCQVIAAAWLWLQQGGHGPSGR